ncbi:GHKL domain-containing protein [Reichenbachiella faecimaris]|uniref:GHKL domain-containing protein n=1 Tax=Reichenbachiella faecimaris TaxID=692418 RepID=A0A1W2G8J0_REIFA|nr:histidine kinase [Reichenbachiella faecimaris]SMD32606.1 GHKL domain-containing protein [Reichenbachiella faecimaris]
MINPILKNREHILVYGLFWLLLIIIHTMLLHWGQQVIWSPALVEAIVYGCGFALVGLSIWFVVRFTGLTDGNLWNAIMSHLAAGGLLIFIWLATSYFITGYLLEYPTSIRQASIVDVWWRVALGAIYYLLVALIYYLLIFYQNYKEKQIREIEMESTLKETELSMLKAQINPHFIFNSLNSISSLTLTRPEDAHEMIVKLSSFLRYTIGHSETELVSLSQEIETIQLYLEIEKLRFGKKLEVNFEGADVIPESAKLPNLILQPLIENAIKYGVYESTSASTIEVHIAYSDRHLQIEITNSTEDDSVAHKGKGIGLKNVRGRLQLIYESADLLQTHKKENEFKVQLTIPQLDQ